MLIDSDLASNNGGWQWSSGTGTDPQPYFRIFNPYNQSEKVRRRTPNRGGPGANGQPRLTRLGITFESSFLSLAVYVVQVGEPPFRSGCHSAQPFPDIYKPSPKAAEKLGYPLPLIAHDKARDRALRRYKNPGTD